MTTVSSGCRNLTTLFSILVLIIFNIKYTYSVRCDRTPEGHGASKSPSDGRYRIRISGNPERYVPGEVYTISLAGIRSMQVPHKFSGFSLAAEKDVGDMRESFSLSTHQNSANVGTFQLYGDALTKFSEKCPHVVTQTSSIPKSEIQVLWTAPASGSGCISIRATVIEHRDVWYMDDGPLSRTICEDEADSVDTQPSIVNPCCACDEAKYELTFEGLWSRHTHPKDFPSNGWLTRFSDVIGASHTVEYRFWEYGQTASEGLRQVAEHGSTRMLESELKKESEHIRTIIKARGISYPNVTGKTFAVFRVDSNHHLVSLVSMIDPSPDWIVGVSGLELCLSNCSWIENKVLNLYPWDAGTDSGPTYIAPDQPTHPREVIRRIKSNYPNDPRSPFYDSTGVEMKPLARLYISRQRLYEKTCEATSQEDQTGGDNKACETEPWGQWSECNAQCGKGKRLRQRSYVNPMLANRAGCKKKLTQREMCTGSSPYCDEPAENEDNRDDENPLEPECALNEWGPWSNCSTECGKGVRTRSRTYKIRRAKKKCQRGSPNPPKLEHTEECQGELCGGDIITQPMTSRYDDDDPRCKMTEWSTWSPCSVTCGVGKKMRTRMLVNKNFDYNVHHHKIVNYYHLRIRNSFENEDEDEDYEENSLRNPDPDDPCGHIAKVEETPCGFEQPTCNSELYGIPDFCFEDPKPGNCRTTTNRWYYDRNLSDCAIFSFTGCKGNTNNFMSREDCLAVCKSKNFDNIPIRDQRIQIDCNVTHWKRGPCNVTCGDGYRVKTRTIITHPENGGIQCPKKLKRYEKCRVKCDESVRHDMDPTWGPSSRFEPSYSTCEYSNWAPWSPCSRTCGDYAVQQRTRYVLNPSEAPYCPHRLEERKCDIMPCLLGN